jgi:hypothetical protein
MTPSPVPEFSNIKNTLEALKGREGVVVMEDNDSYEFSCGILDVDISMSKRPGCELRLSDDHDVYAIFWNSEMTKEQVQLCAKEQLAIIDAFFDKKLVSIEATKSYLLGIRRKTRTYAIQADESFVDLKGRKIDSFDKITSVS